jgi:hypothetical protein
VLEDRGEPDSNHDRNDRGGIAGAGHDDRDAEERVVEVHLERRPGKERACDRKRRRDVHHARVDEGGSDRCTDELVAAEVLCGRIAEHDREEIEEAVAHGVEDHVDARGRRKHAEGGKEGDEALDDAVGGKDRKRRHEDGGHRAHEAVHGVVLRISVCLCRCWLDCACTLDVKVCQDLVVEACDLGADDDLVLAAGFDDLDDTTGLLEHIRLCQLRILEREAQPCHAVREGAYVVRSSDVVHDGLGKSLVICHPTSPLLIRAI